MPCCDNNCNCQENKSSGFIFGLVLGAIIGAIVAIIVYKNNKTQIFSDLKEKLENLFKGFSQNQKEQKPPSKKVSLRGTPSDEAIPLVKKKPKTFIKPKKRA